MNIIIYGPPGSGKSTQAKLLTEKLGLIRIASGDISRQIASEDTDEGHLVRDFINQGGLTPDDILFRRIRKIFDDSNLTKGVIMDGYPRNEDQILLVENMLAEKNIQVDKVVVIDLSEDESQKRMLARASIEKRADDTVDVIANRFRVYHQRTEPIIKYYDQKNKVVHVDGHGTIDQVQDLILQALHD